MKEHVDLLFLKDKDVINLWKYAFPKVFLFQNALRF